MSRTKITTINPANSVDLSQHLQTGDLRMAPSNDVPLGWLACEGQLVEKADYPLLYNYLTKNGTVTNPWGSDVGTQFRVPDFRGVMPRGRDNAKADDPDAAGRTARGLGGATGDNVGSYQGDNNKSHAHGVSHSLGTGNAGAHSHAVTLPWVAGGGGGDVAAFTLADTTPGNTVGTSGIGDHSHSVGGTITAANDGGNETRPKNVYVLFIIKA